MLFRSAKITCAIEGRTHGFSLNEVVAPGVERWIRHRYEAEVLLRDIEEAGYVFAKAAEATDYAHDDALGHIPVDQNSRTMSIHQARVLACGEGGQWSYCDLDKGHDGPHYSWTSDTDERWFDKETIEQKQRESSIHAHQLMKARREGA